jgi:glucose/arabinose dehydrogenase
MYNPAIADMVSMAGRVQRDAVGAEIVTQTLDAANSSGFSMGLRAPVGISNNPDYTFQTNVLNAAYSGRGTFVNMMT